MAANPVMHSKTKHFELDLHFVREEVQQKYIHLVHIPGQYQVADIFTKPISGASFFNFKSKLMVEHIPTTSLRGDVKG